MSFLNTLEVQISSRVGGWAIALGSAVINNANINNAKRSFVWLGCCVALASCSINTQSLVDANQLMVANTEEPICVETENPGPSCPTSDPLPNSSGPSGLVNQSGTPIITHENTFLPVPWMTSYGQDGSYYLMLGYSITYNNPLWPEGGGFVHDIFNVESMTPDALSEFSWDMQNMGGIVSFGGLSRGNKSQSVMIVTFNR